jgi:hypothetical protein
MWDEIFRKCSEYSLRLSPLAPCLRNTVIVRKAESAVSLFVSLFVSSVLVLFSVDVPV